MAVSIGTCCSLNWVPFTSDAQLLSPSSWWFPMPFPLIPILLASLDLVEQILSWLPERGSTDGKLRPYMSKNVFILTPYLIDRFSYRLEETFPQNFGSISPLFSFVQWIFIFIVPDWVLAFGVVAEKSKGNLISNPLYVTFSPPACGIFSLFQAFKKFTVLCLVWIYFHPFCWVLRGLICSVDSCPSVLDIFLEHSVEDFLVQCLDAGLLSQGGTLSYLQFS